MDYLYDESFDGLLTSIYLNYYEAKANGIYPVSNYQFSFISSPKLVKTDPLKAAKVYKAVENKISSVSLQHIYYVYLSNHPRKENLILRYVQLGFKLGPKIDSLHTHPDVQPVLEISKKVTFEVHRFLGLLRFVEYPNFLYAVLEPDHNILVLLADHFTDRLARENFIIHDKKRKLALIYNQQEWYITDFSETVPDLVSEKEQFFQNLWKTYFRQISIANRKNKRLQNHFIPQRYRHNLVEFSLTPDNSGTKRQ